MTSRLVVAPPDDVDLAAEISTLLSLPMAVLEINTFPDKEMRVRVPASADEIFMIYRLDDPDKKILQLIFALSALRDLGARNITLITPYLCYMRQDKAFARGEAVSQRVFAKVISPWIDRLITIDPHLHRVPSLKSVFPDIEDTVCLSAISLLADTIDNSRDTLLIGPDKEADQWVGEAARIAKLPYATLVKERYGDRQVIINLDTDIEINNKNVILIDDVISSGTTAKQAAKLLKRKGATQIDLLIVHALASRRDVAEIHEAGVASIKSTNSVRHDSNEVSIAPLLAKECSG
jgi:ribose-phosphate pyrophosphokinase